MSLQRTPSGLANMRLFFKVDRVVYCEGGAMVPLQDIEAGLGDEETLDVCYWQTVFRNFGSGVSTHFKSVGSKQNLVTLARSLIAHNIPEVYVCLDRDHDSHLGTLISDPRVIYTFGYSWENDVVACEPLEAVFFQFRNRTAAAEADYAASVIELDRFFTAAQKYCACDVYFISRSNEGLFNRDAPPSAIAISKTAPPKLNETYLRSRLTAQGYKRLPTTRFRVTRNDVGQRLFGKALGSFVYQLIRFFAKPSHGNFASYDNFMRSAVMRFDDSLRNGRLINLRNYFQPIVP